MKECRGAQKIERGPHAGPFQQNPIHPVPDEAGTH
jgi:hypothetical protein